MKEDKRVIKTKKLLKQTLIKLLETETFEKITISEICDVALVNRVTFYNHYKDKYELFTDHMNDIIVSVIYEAEECVKNKDANKEEKAFLMLTSVADNILYQGKKYKRVLSTFNHEENAILVYLVQKMVTESIKEFLESVLDVNLLKYSIEPITAFVVGGTLNTLSSFVNDSLNVTYDQLVNQCNRMISEMINKQFLY